MKALVTGSGGFVGRHLVEHLVSCGDTVAEMDHHASDALDITNAETVRHRMLDAAPDAVYHLAAISHVGSSWSAPLEVFQVNAVGTLNVLTACREAGVRRVLVIGSADEYGVVKEADLPLTEDTPLRPLTPYGASKAAAEQCALQAFLGDGLGAIRVRAFNHTGPGQSDRFVVSSLARRIAQAERRGETEIVIGNLDVVRDFSDVRDVVRAYRLLVEHGEPGEVYNVCSGLGTSIADIADQLIARSERLLSLVIDPELVRPIDIPRLVGDNSRLRKATTWEPEIALPTTLDDVLNHWRSTK